MNSVPHVGKFVIPFRGNGSENCPGTEIGWKPEAVEANRPVFKPTDE